MRHPVFAVPLLLLGAAQIAGAQQTRTVTGTVTNAATSQPIEDITVSAVGTNAVTRTDGRGQYRLVVPAGDVTLVARGIGYKRITQRVPAGQTAANFALEKDVLQLEQVTVTGQATTIETRNATTAVAVVSGQEVNRAPAQSIEQALQGKVLGAKIDMNSGAPGGGAQIQIRGVTSVIGNGQPLIVVDGVIFSNEAFSSGANSVTGAGGGLGGGQDALVNRLADLNPNEIESVEILKSAAATAIYGSRATNGVVVIKTKRGASGQSRFTLSQRVGTQQMLRGVGTRKFSDVQTIIDLPYGNGGNTAAVNYLRQAFPSGQIPASANYDLEDKFYDNKSPSYATTLGLTAGNDRTSLYSSLTNDHETGLAPNTGRDLTAGRFNVDHNFSSKLKASASANLTRNVLRRGLSNNDNASVSPVYMLAYLPNVIDLSQKVDGAYPVNPFNGGGNATSNIFQTFEHLKLQENVWRMSGAVNLGYTAWETAKQRVTLQAQAGFDRFQQDGQLYSPGFLQYEGNDGFVGRAVQTNVNSLNYNYNASATHVWTPGAIASFTTNVGAGYEQQGFDLARYRTRGLLPGIASPAIAGGASSDQEGNRNLFRDQALFVTEQILAFSDRLALTGGVRLDRSSANGDREKWYTWPRAAASYRFDTPFVPTMDNLKLRASWGTTGNRPRFTDRFIVLGTGSVIGGQSSLVTAQTVNNPSIKPEKLTEIEAGTDVSFFGSRAVFEATYYDRKLTDQLFTAPVAPSSGVTQLVLNTGRLINQGVELGLSTIPIQRRDWTYTNRLGFSRNVQKVDQLPASIPRFNVPGSFGAAFGRNAIVSGEKTTAIYGNIPFKPGTSERLPENFFALNPNARSGTDYVVKDTIVADANPDFLLNFGNTLTWKRWTVAAQLDYRQGGYVANMTHLLYDEGGTSRDYDEPSPVSGTPLGEFRYNAWNGGNDVRPYLQSGTNFRIREVQVAFEAPESLARRVRARSMRLSLQGRNLWMATDYWSYDPEFNNFGNTNLNRFIDLAPFPGVRQFSLSVDLGF